MQTDEVETKRKNRGRTVVFWLVIVGFFAAVLFVGFLRVTERETPVANESEDATTTSTPTTGPSVGAIDIPPNLIVEVPIQPVQVDRVERVDPEVRIVEIPARSEPTTTTTTSSTTTTTQPPSPPPTTCTTTPLFGICR